MILGRQFSQTEKLIRFILRRDRIRILIWLLVLTTITLIIAPAYTQLFSTEKERLVMAETVQNPAMVAMLGPAYSLDNYTIGVMFASQMLLFTAIAVAIMNIFIVTRHTREDEENGRIEVIRSLPVGKLSNVTSATIVAIGVNILLSLIIGIGLWVLGIESMGFEGSLLYGSALGVVGIFFTAVTIIFVQLSESTRGTIGFSFFILGLAYLIRAIGDVGNETLSLFSPLGLILRTQIYANNNWWPIIITLITSFFILAIAFYLNSIRDLEAGFIPARSGRKKASIFLNNSLSLGLRLQRTAIISWIIGIFILGASYGSVMGDISSFIESNDMYRQLIIMGEGFSLTDQFITTIMSVIAIFCAIPSLLMILKLKKEEKKNRVEQLLARVVPRNKLLLSFLIISITMSFVTLSLAAVGMWSAGVSVMDDPISFIPIFKAGIVYLPALWIMIGLATLLLGFYSNGTVLTWLFLVYSFFVVYLGKLLQFPQWMEKLSPFGNIPQLPVEDMNWFKIISLTIIALIFIVTGFYGYNKRDINVTGNSSLFKKNKKSK
ncbi:MAG: ABC-2 transporter permease [Halanaerobiales bacterium]|nr:ABC-2 transporter permease [Halanaerobiales bacterium]